MSIAWLSFFFSYLKVTNTFVLPSWAEAWCKCDVMLFIRDCLHGSLPYFLARDLQTSTKSSTFSAEIAVETLTLWKFPQIKWCPHTNLKSCITFTDGSTSYYLELSPPCWWNRENRYRPFDCSALVVKDATELVGLIGIFMAPEIQISVTLSTSRETLGLNRISGAIAYIPTDLLVHVQTQLFYSFTNSYLLAD